MINALVDMLIYVYLQSMAITEHLSVFIINDILHEMALSTDFDTIYIMSCLNKLFAQLTQRYYDRIVCKEKITSTDKDERKILYACQYGSHRLLQHVCFHKFLKGSMLHMAIDYICQNDNIFIIEDIIEYADDATRESIYRTGALCACHYNNKKQFEFFRKCANPFSKGDVNKLMAAEKLLSSCEFWECSLIGACSGKNTELAKYLLPMFLGNIDSVVVVACTYGDMQTMMELSKYGAVMCDHCGKLVKDHFV